MSAADSSLPWMGPGGMDTPAVALSVDHDFPIALRIAGVQVEFTGDVARQLAGLLSALADVVDAEWPWAPMSVHNRASGRPGLIDGEADAGADREAETAAASLAQQEGHPAPLEHGGESALDRVAVAGGVVDESELGTGVGDLHGHRISPDSGGARAPRVGDGPAQRPVMPSRHQAVATIGMHELAAVLGLPAGVHAVAVQVALNPHGVEVLIEGDSLGEVLDGNEAPLYRPNAATA